MKAWLVFFAITLAALQASAASRVAVVVGNNLGAGDEVRLRYAEDDATKVHRVLRELGGFRPEDMVLLKNENTETVRGAIIRVNDRLRAEGGQDGMLVVYYSGHADASALHLGETRFALDELEALVRGSSARMRVLVVDACRSGSITRVKGATVAPAFDIRLRQGDASEGAIFLTSSAANEDAQESDAVGGSFFTHYFVSGLLGAADADGNGRITVGEAYGYAYGATLRASSRSLAGPQHPTFSYDLKGREDVVLTVLASQSGRPIGYLTLLSERSFVVMSGGVDGPVLAEVAADAPMRRLTLAPGRYFVRGRGPDDLVEGPVTVEAGGDRRVADAELERVAYARLVRKGAGDLQHVQGLHAGYEMQTGLWRGSSLCHGAFAGYELVTASVSWTARVFGCRGGFANEVLSSHVDELNLQIEGAHVWDLPALSIAVGLAVGASGLHESFDTRGLAPSRQTLAATLGANVAVEVPVSKSWAVEAALGTNVHAFRQRNTEPTAEWTTPVTLTTRMGAAMRF
jgi:hypothetical protein